MVVNELYSILKIQRGKQIFLITDLVRKYNEIFCILFHHNASSIVQLMLLEPCS